MNFLHFEQFIEQRAVMHYGLAQFLGVRYTTIIADRDGLSRSVGSHNGRVINGDVTRPALEITHGITTLQHKLTDKLVSLHDNLLRVVNKAALQSVPGLAEPSSLWRYQRRKCELLDALLS